MILVEVLAFTRLESRVILSVSKSAIKIFELFRARPNDMLNSMSVYYDRSTLGIPDATPEQISGDFSWLQRNGLITVVLGATEWFRITELGKSTLPEDLIWEDQKDYHDELLPRDSKKRMWMRRAWFSLLLFVAFGVAVLAYTFAGWEDGVYWIIPAVLRIFAPLFLISFFALGVWSEKYALSSEEKVFVMMWEAYQSLRAYETKREPGYLKEAIKKLNGAAGTLQTSERPSTWDLVQNRIYGAFNKLGIYVRSKILPSIEQEKNREVLRQIVTISSLFKERDISGLLSFIEGLGKIEMLARRRRMSLIELRSKPLIFSFVLMGVFSIILFAGSYLVSVIQGQTLVSYAMVIFGLWFTALVAVVVLVLRR